MIDYPKIISEHGLSIYDSIELDDKYLYIPSGELERILSNRLVGFSLSGLPLRTRSKIVKQEICKALGYPVPNSFKKTQPRFLGQNFDVYVQKSLNVQIWNEAIDTERRYVFLQVNDADVVTCVRVITGEELVKYDRTGTLTSKYQATMNAYNKSYLFSTYDTDKVSSYIIDPADPLIEVDPNSYPNRTQLLRISEVYRRLLPMVGKNIDYLDAVQERNRGAELHQMVCNYLGYSSYNDNGNYPDVANQLLEIKLQTSPTIDLGLHSPTDGRPVMDIGGMLFCSDDVRYAIFSSEVCGNRIFLKHLYVVSGQDFPKYFPLFGGKGKNIKIQLSLPYLFFNS